MKKRILSFFSLTLLAISSNAQFRIGPEIGLNVSNASVSGGTFSAGGISIATSSLLGARIGISADYSFNESLSLQGGMFYSMMGYKQNSLSLSLDSANSVTIPSITTTINYIHLPIHIVYKVDAGPGKFFIGIGPYISYGISGKITLGSFSYGGISTPSISTDIKFNNNTDTATISTSAKPFDYGIDAITGYELPAGLLFRLGYSYGFSNFSNQNGATDKNTCFYFSAAWLFSNDHKRK